MQKVQNLYFNHKKFKLRIIYDSQTVKYLKKNEDIKLLAFVFY